MVYFDYDSIIGTAIFTHGECVKEMPIYGGKNCLAVMVYETRLSGSNKIHERLHAYFDDEKHLKRLLGVGKEKGYEDNLFYKSDLSAFRFNKEHPDTPTFVKCLAQAKWDKNITIEPVNWNDASLDAERMIW